MPNKKNILKYFIYLTVVLFISAGVILRFQFLGKTFWMDEWMTIEKILSMFQDHTANPYHLLNYFLIKIFGINELFLRLFSIIFSLLSIVGIYHIGNRFFKKSVGLIAAGLFAVFPYNIILAQEVRIYSMLSFLSIIHLYFLFTIISNFLSKKTTPTKLLVAYFFITILMLFTHLSGSILFVSEMFALSALFVSKKINLSDWKKINYLNVSSFVLFAVWHFRVIFSKLGFFISNDTYIEKFVSVGNLFWDIAISLFNITVGYSFSACLLVLFLMVIFIFYIPSFRKNIFANGRALCDQKRIYIIFISLSVFTYLAINYTLGTFIPRHFFIISPFIAILLGAFIIVLLDKKAILGSIVILSIFSVSLDNSILMQRDDANSFLRKWSEMGAYIKENENKADAVFITEPFLTGIFSHYYSGFLPILSINDYKNITDNSLIKYGEIGISFVDQPMADIVLEELQSFRRFFLVRTQDMALNDKDDLIINNIEKKYLLFKEMCLSPNSNGFCLDYYQIKD